MISKPIKSGLIQNFVPAYAKVNKYPKRSVHVGSFTKIGSRWKVHKTSRMRQPVFHDSNLNPLVS